MKKLDYIRLNRQTPFLPRGATIAIWALAVCLFSFLPNQAQAFYNPQTGHWLSREPLGESESANLFQPVGNDVLNHFDLNGFFGEAGHFYTTYAVARAAGFDDERAFTIAYWSQYPDEEKSFEAIHSGDKKSNKLIGDEEVKKYLHSLTGGDPKKMRKYLECLLKSDEFGFEEKGILIHALGDSYAHTYDKTVEQIGYAAPFGGPVTRSVSIPETLYSPVLGHGLDGHTPDYIASNPEKYAKYVDQLYNILKGIGGDAPANPDIISELKKQASSLKKPGYADTWSESKNGQGNYEAEQIRNVGGGFNESSRATYHPENGWQAIAGMGKDKAFRDKLIGKIKNGVKGCCLN